MSQIIYNGVDLGYAFTERVSQVPEYDPSGVDQLFTLFTISAQSILYPGVGSVNPGEDPAAAMVRLRHMLAQPRQDFRYRVNGVDVINSAGRDDANGPETTCDYTQLNAGSFLVNFTCKVRLTDCANAAGRSYLSLKWSDTLTYDPQWIATRRRTGTLILSARRTTDPDSYRPVVTPDVPSGFRREAAEYTLSEDGRIVRFSFTDKEMMTSPPFPAVRMKGVQVEAAAPPGSISQGQVRLRLDGAKGTNKRDLLNAAVFAATDRVHAAGFYRTPGGRIFKGWSVSEGLGDDECWVEVAVNWRVKPEPGRVTNAGAAKAFTAGAVAGLLLPGLGGQLFGGTAAPPVPNAKGQNLAGLSTGVPWVGKTLPNSDPDRAISPPTYGTADALRLAFAALNDPCGQDAELRAGGGDFDARTSELRTAPFPFPGGLGGGVPSSTNQRAAAERQREARAGVDRGEGRGAAGHPGRRGQPGPERGLPAWHHRPRPARARRGRGQHPVRGERHLRIRVPRPLEGDGTGPAAAVPVVRPGRRREAGGRVRLRLHRLPERDPAGREPLHRGRGGRRPVLRGDDERTGVHRSPRLQPRPERPRQPVTRTGGVPVSNPTHRPRRLTEGTVRAAARLILAGATRRQAADALAIGESTFRLWMGRGLE